MPRGLTTVVLLAAASVFANAGRITTNSAQDMSDGDAGSFWDLGGDAFFGFSSDGWAPPYWGALITIPIGATADPTVVISSVTIFYDPGQFGGTNDPLVGDSSGVGGTLATSADDGLMQSMGCNVIGVQPNAGGGIPTSLSNPEFVANQTTSVFCQFASPFPTVDAQSTAFYAVVGLDSVADPPSIFSGQSQVFLTFFDSDPTAGIPEPGTIALCLGGLAAIALRRRLIR